MIAARLANMAVGDNQHTTEVAPIDATSKAEAAEKLSTSPKSVERAKAVLTSGLQSLIDLCDQDRLIVSLATEAPGPSSMSDCAIIEADGMDIGE